MNCSYKRIVLFVLLMVCSSCNQESAEPDYGVEPNNPVQPFTAEKNLIFEPLDTPNMTPSDQQLRANLIEKYQVPRNGEKE